MPLNDSLCNHTSVGKIVMDCKLFSSAVLWLSPIALNDGCLKPDDVTVEHLCLFQTAAAWIEESLPCY